MPPIPTPPPHGKNQTLSHLNGHPVCPLLLEKYTEKSVAIKPSPSRARAHSSSPLPKNPVAKVVRGTKYRNLLGGIQAPPVQFCSYIFVPSTCAADELCSSIWFSTVLSIHTRPPPSGWNIRPMCTCLAATGNTARW